MANVPENLHYSKDHEWVRVEGDTAVIGITDHAQDQLGDVVYVELPRAADEFVANESFGSVESVKAVSEIFTPVSGKVAEANDSLTDEPEIGRASCRERVEIWRGEVRVEKKKRRDV